MWWGLDDPPTSPQKTQRLNHNCWGQVEALSESHWLVETYRVTSFACPCSFPDNTGVVLLQGHWGFLELFAMFAVFGGECPNNVCLAVAQNQSLQAACTLGKAHMNPSSMPGRCRALAGGSRSLWLCVSCARRLLLWPQLPPGSCLAPLAMLSEGRDTGINGQFPGWGADQGSATLRDRLQLVGHESQVTRSRCKSWALSHLIPTSPGATKQT